MSDKFNRLSQLFRDRDPGSVEPQAGGKGLSIPQLVDSYLARPGQLLSIKRFFAGQTVDDVARDSKLFNASDLVRIEQGAVTPDHRELVDLARSYEIELRVLLEAYDHVSADASAESMGLAAQASEPLTAREKLDLAKLVAAFRRGDGSEV